ncbi:MAG TPA: alpha/beta fold hydrolase [Thermoanaerobaculia bacterium]|nr:alpha/beta fold hydrolase [Thermoanaerobaculia bacterium]
MISRIHHAFPAVLVVLAAAGTALPGCAAEPPRRPALNVCNKPDLPPDALCGTYKVFENRAARTGRKVPLAVVVLPATGPAAQRLPDPITYFAGGPGDASIPEGLFFAGELASLRPKRDVLLVDLRGTGQSGGLFCPEVQGKQGVQDFLDNFLPTGQIHACRDRLKKEVDLAWYTSDTAIDDVEELRRALGYGPLNLIGGSYGTRAVLTYLRRHPRSVRTATLLGVVTPDEKYPLGTARSSQKALDGWIAECEGDAACRGAFPDLRQEVDAVLRRAATDPVRVELTDPATGKPSELRLGHKAVAQTLRYMLYSTSGAVLLPLTIHQAAQGDWQPLAQAARLHGSVMSSAADGFYQSVTCAEDVPFIREGEVAAAVAGTFLGDFRIRQQQAACQGWPVRKLGPETRSPVVSDVPALLVSGERDPATPAENGERVVRTLKRGRHLVIADAGHSPQGMLGGECLSGTIAAFIAAGAAEGLDTSCIAAMRRTDFVLSAGDPEVKAAPAELARLVGSYANPEKGLVATVAVAGNRLRLTFSDGYVLLLIPTAPTRFRFEGQGPQETATFQVTGERATSLTLSRPGDPDLVLTRVAIKATQPETGP